MRFVRLRRTGEVHLGVSLDQAILDLTAAQRIVTDLLLPTTMRAVFKPSAFEQARALQARIESSSQLRDQLTESGALVPFLTADLAAPIDDPALLLAIGMNYHDHLREMRAPVPAVPYSFTKNCAAIIGPYDNIVLPASNPDMVDLEAELVIVIGSPCYEASESEAALCIGGYTIANDVSARDWIDTVFSQTGLMETITTWELNLLGKQFPTFCPLGPYLVTSDDVPNVSNLKIVSRVNGEVFQSSNTSDLIFSPAQIVSYYSRFYRFVPGDMILTGTPAGVGFSRSPRRFFQPGDVIDVEIESLGRLRNTVHSAST